MNQAARAAWWAGLLVTGLLGCQGDTGPKLYPVQGQVTLNGEPLTGVIVHFSPVDGDPAKTASGQVDSTGNYTLRSGPQGKAGALPGRYKVYLTPIAPVPQEGQSYGGSGPQAPGESAGSPQAGPNIPQAWLSAATTQFEVDVKAEPNTIPIDVK